MLTQVLWWIGIALVGLLLIRAASGSLFSKYLVFYSYLFQVLLSELVRFYFYTFHHISYRTVYWYTQFFSLAVGYCVIWEIYRQALSAYPGTLRLARSIIIGIFVIIVAKFLVNDLNGSIWGSVETVMDLERNFRTVEAVLMVVIGSVLTYYMIPIGQNLRGIIIGYSFFVGTCVVNIALRSHFGEAFQMAWRYFQSAAWIFTLVIWFAKLWSYYPNPRPEDEIAIERDYEWLSVRTANAVASARSHVLRGVRQ